MSILFSLPIYPNTILCGDFNARLGDITGDSVMSPCGTAMVPWFEEQSLSVLNASLSYGIATWHGFWQQCTCSSILDLFLCNFDMTSPSMHINTDLSLGSDQCLMSLSFSYDMSLSSCSSSSPSSSTIHPRCLWNLAHLKEQDPCDLYANTFTTLSSPLSTHLHSLVTSCCVPTSIQKFSMNKSTQVVCCDIQNTL
ncbi:hypothetical protein BDF14DRAFT_142685 [Spinellus fusiger]|nr:hypothetical protein BDF14DRAFT_142685 [Spinellus fusiger]